ncbi:hypothetical protein [Zobellia sp. 1_MG-2023]|uniref:hypothetical protein n=1 Tax=Zobellia sp. 1_MG-2023 TaxID=3062626 RepID=UPI0026E41FCF|nr:hypothetical protein [Zobellia sp. 1_MG-2023]MDO6818094.1 hypothetical protein [Zobellia sp. 1_MG-2023]
MPLYFYYLIFGLTFSIIASEIDKMDIENHSKNIMTNTDRIIFILLWPIILIYTIKNLKK